MSIEDIDLSEEDLASLEGDIEEVAEVTPAPAKPVAPPVLTKITAATDEDCTNFVANVVAQYPGLVKPSAHWTLTILSIMAKVKYSPTRRVLANPKDLPASGRLDEMIIVQRHVSTEMLEGLEARIAEFCVSHPEILRGESEVESLIETDEGGLAYIDGKVEVEKSNSESKEGWASW